MKQCIKNRFQENYQSLLPSKAQLAKQQKGSFLDASYLEEVLYFHGSKAQLANHAFLLAQFATQHSRFDHLHIGNHLAYELR